MASNYNTMLQRQDSAPDEKRLVTSGDLGLDELLYIAVKRYLQSGSQLVKDAALKGRQTLQFAPGTTPTNQPAQPAVGSPFSPAFTADVMGTNSSTPGAYIVTMVSEVASFRYTTSGAPPSSTFGMLVPAGSFIYMVLQDWQALQLVGLAGAIINIELFQIDA